MHHSLHIDEILNTIFSDPILSGAAEDCHVDQTNSSIDRICRRYSLLSLALTCKSFYEPATRILWRQINGLDRLIGSMSKDVVQRIGPHSRRIFSPEVEQGEGFDVIRPRRRYMTFKKNPTEEHWKNFERLATYVQEFDGIDDQNNVFRLEDDILQALGNRYRGTHIFPLLRVLSCRGCNELRCVKLLLSQELHTLRIFFENNACARHDSQSEKRLPVLNHLKHIHFAATNAPLDLCVPVSNFLLAHATINLKSVYVTGIPIRSEVAQTILQCQALEEMALKVTSFDMEDLFDIDLPRHNLRKFHMVSETPVEGTEIGGKLKDSFYTKLIRKLRAPNLVDFQFSGGSWFPYASDIKCLLETMLGHEHFSDENQAQTIRLMPPHWQGSIELPLDPLPYICTFVNALHVLTRPIPSDLTRSCSSELQVLDLDEAYVDISDKELGILGESLPHLKSLIFSSRAYGTGRRKSRTTLTGLWLLAKQCKSLEDLGLLIDATIDREVFKTLTTFDGDHDNIEARFQHYALARNANVHNLYLGESTIGDERLAGEFLGIVFPKILNLFYTRSRTETNEMVKWRAIKHNLAGPILG